MIVHTCKTMTVKEYSDYEAKRDMRLLYRKWWRWLPVGLFADDVQAFVNEFNTLFNGGDDKLVESWEQLKQLNYINLLRAYLYALQAHTYTRAELVVLAGKVGYEVKQDDVLPKLLEDLKKTTGIEIKSLEDYVVFGDEVQRKIDKYNEKYGVKKEVKGITILELFTASCRVLEVTHDYSKMTLWEFANFKKQAEEHSRRMEEIYKKHG